MHEPRALCQLRDARAPKADDGLPLGDSNTHRTSCGVVLISIDDMGGAREQSSSVKVLVVQNVCGDSVLPERRSRFVPHPEHRAVTWRTSPAQSSGR